jgi:hypothetical protein
MTMWEGSRAWRHRHRGRSRRHARIAGEVHRTPPFRLQHWGNRSARVFLKAESFQKSGSFKARGAITFSSGNHAQAMAWAARGGDGGGAGREGAGAAWGAGGDLRERWERGPAET